MNHSSLLLIEYLHADTDSWNSAPASMRLEAAVMVAAIVDSVVRETGLAATVLLSPITPSPIQFLDNEVQQSTSIVRYDNKQPSETSGPGIFRSIAELLPQHTHAIIIAPESDGILTRLIQYTEQQIAQLPSRSIKLLNLNSELTSVFSDKQQTCRWLTAHGLPTIPTWTLNELPDPDCLSGHSDTQSRLVVKPRDGAGSDQIRVLNTTKLPTFLLDHDTYPIEYWIMQPYVEGTACSCGLIGLGPQAAPLILPSAYQQIIQRNGELRYVGGSLPAQQSHQDLIAPVMHELQHNIGGFYGYVGVDLLVNPLSEIPVKIVEINPRICTSIVGYFKLFENSLTRVMFGLTPSDQLRQRTNTMIRFHANESFSPIIGPLQSTE